MERPLNLLLLMLFVISRICDVKEIMWLKLLCPIQSSFAVDGLVLKFLFTGHKKVIVLILLGNL